MFVYRQAFRIVVLSFGAYECEDNNLCTKLVFGKHFRNFAIGCIKYLFKIFIVKTNINERFVVLMN